MKIRLPNALPGIHFIEVVHQETMLSALFVIESGFSFGRRGLGLRLDHALSTFTCL
jgi:hypothetical protein